MNISFTPAAEQKILEFMAAQTKGKTYLRIVVPSSSRDGYQYQFFLDEQENFGTDDASHSVGAFEVVVDSATMNKVDGARVDWVEGPSGSGFKVDNPNAPKVDLSAPVAERIQQVLDLEINPSLASHGGAVELIEVRGPRAFVRLSGGCQGCASSKATLKQGIEVRIKEVAPEILEVIDTTDHAAGSNPYFTG